MRLIVPPDTALYHQLQTLARNQRLVFFAGLPGTGKSLLIHQLAHLAVAGGRTVHLLQWDVARPVFEASPPGQRYPMVHGITHGVVRKAIGLWARHLLVRWHQQHHGPSHLLIGEVPCIGHRLIELARPYDDPAERLLTDASSRFVIPVPSPQVRGFVEAERRRRQVDPVHDQETQDAPPSVLQALWHELARIAPRLGVARTSCTIPLPYDPALYQGVYQVLLRHRHTHVMPVDTLLPTTTVSVYDFAIERTCIMPSSEEVARFIEAVEQHYPDAKTLQREMDQWYLV
jgi:hypothetical protein